jgi:UDP-perosamine 4-acetyltransferase
MKMRSDSQLPFVIIGAGGHASVVADALRALGVAIRGMTDREASRKGLEVMGIPILGDDAILATLGSGTVCLANGIGVRPRACGGVPPDAGTGRRRGIFIGMRADGFAFPPIIHPSAVVSDAAEIASGAQIMAGAVIQPRARIGENAVINTSVSVDHDCRIGAHAFVAPGAVLCGNVTIGEGALIGAGAVVLPGRAIGENALIGAGAVVRGDVGDRQFGV